MRRVELVAAELPGDGVPETSAAASPQQQQGIPAA
jgi:hypothetical protein